MVWTHTKKNKEQGKDLKNKRLETIRTQSKRKFQNNKDIRNMKSNNQQRQIRRKRTPIFRKKKKSLRNKK